MLKLMLVLLDKSKTYYLHVLGLGYSLDTRLSATKQLSDVTLSRLIEAIVYQRCYQITKL